MAETLKTAPVTVVLSLGADTPFTKSVPVSVIVANDHDIDRSFWKTAPVFNLDLEFHNGPGDNYRISIHVDGYETSGGFVQARLGVHQTAGVGRVRFDSRVVRAGGRDRTAGTGERVPGAG